MRVSRRSFVGCIAGLMATTVEAQVRLRVGGEVLDKDNKPITSVLVRAYRGKEKIGESTTGRDGKYSIEFDSGTPIDTVRYDQTAYIPGIVDDLCGTREQRINKTLYLRGSKLALFPAQEALSALERIYFVDSLNKVPFLTVRDEYLPILKNMAVPKELDDRLRMVTKLYQG